MPVSVEIGRSVLFFRFFYSDIVICFTIFVVVVVAVAAASVVIVDFSAFDALQLALRHSMKPLYVIIIVLSPN